MKRKLHKENGLAIRYDEDNKTYFAAVMPKPTARGRLALKERAFIYPSGARVVRVLVTEQPARKRRKGKRKL